MAKNMYQKREERKSKKMNNDGKSFSNVSINWYPGHMAKAKKDIVKLLKLIDIIYEVIDARIPYSSKIKDMDTFILDKPKILIMTKFDLADITETSKWIKYYESLGYIVVSANLLKNFNANKLIKLTDDLLAKKEKRRTSLGLLKRKYRALILGIPNVGKSTLINSIVGKKVTKVGNRPGITKALGWIRINNRLELLDSPGILWPKLDDKQVALNLAAMSAIKENLIPIPEVSTHILEILSTYYPNRLEERYDIKIDNLEQMIEAIGQKRKALSKDNQIDYSKVYTIIYNDLKEGRFKGVTFDRYE